MFQRLMDHVLLGMQGTELFVYLDDIIIYVKTHEEHEDKVLRTYERLSKNFPVPKSVTHIRQFLGLAGYY